MRFPDILAAFDDAIEWADDDLLLADHLPSQLASDDRWVDDRWLTPSVA